jgi:hypothetical protein
MGDPGAYEAAQVELAELDDAGRQDLAQAVVPAWNNALSSAITYLWHVCRKLGYDPETLDPKHVSLVAAMFLGEEFTDIVER